MKRRLQKAYDHMTMPDDCARRIEQQLLNRQEEQKTGRHIRAVAPTSDRGSGWITAVAAVCLMLVLSVGGTMLFLGNYDAAVTAPTEITVAVHQTIPGDYTTVTDIPAAEVEAFAQAVQKNILEGDWEAFVQKVHYPIEIQDRTIGNEGGLTGLLIRNEVSEDFQQELRKESCNAMFCNWQGICMGGGRLWINEVEGELKVTAINGMFADLVDIWDFNYSKLPDGNYAITAYSGRAEGITFASGYNGSTVTRIGSGEPVIRNGDAVKTVTIPETVTEIADRAFAGCEGLESIHFRGDAPAEAENVFEGSDNVTVYYLEGTSGWGDTWCGRKTAIMYTSSYIFLGTAQVDAEWSFLGILQETAEFHSSEQHRSFTISEYCEERSETLGATVTIPKFTLVDMDRDGVKELVLWVDIEGDTREDYLILRVNHEGDGSVYTLLEPQQQITDLRKDGSFYWRGNGSVQGKNRILLDGDEIRYLEYFSGTEKPPAQWHAYYCHRADVVLASYQYVTGTGWTRLPGRACAYTELLASGKMDNSWPLLEEELTRLGLICREEGNEIFVYDPDAPGCQFYGTVNEAGEFLTVGYYISNEYGERQAEVRELLSGEPVYQVGVNLEDLDAHGREVARIELLMEYLS